MAPSACLKRGKIKDEEFFLESIHVLRGFFRSFLFFLSYLFFPLLLSFYILLLASVSAHAWHLLYWHYCKGEGFKMDKPSALRNLWTTVQRDVNKGWRQNVLTMTILVPKCASEQEHLATTRDMLKVQQFVVNFLLLWTLWFLEINVLLRPRLINFSSKKMELELFSMYELITG